jgi:hypothetical protein
MDATQIVLQGLAALGSVRDDEGDISVEKLQQFTAKWVAMFAGCIVSLENRIERMQGRAGIPDDSLGRILSEFLGGGV